MSGLVHEEGAETTGRKFPLPIVCPKCRQNIGQARCRCPAATELKWESGIPRTLFGQKYWGETSSEKMRQVLDLTSTMHWKDALAAVVKGEAVETHLLEPVGPDVVHAFPWSEIKTVLDIGAGMGFISSALARYAETVVSLEAVPERAKFIAARARQDGLPMYPIIANGLEPPFPDESFDLITLNGVFEYLGLWAEGDPEAVQRNFLKTVHRLLKPNGYLYIGIETRFAFGNFMGGRDHSGTAYTSLMPRRMADAYCRLRARPIYGAEHINPNYRTYTYTPTQYKEMVQSAGFGRVSVQGVEGGYNNQMALYDMESHGLRNKVIDIVSPPSSRLGKIRRKITNSRLLYRTLENEVVIFASKSPRQGPLLWNNFSNGSEVAQINTHGKIIALCYDDGSISNIAEASKPTADPKWLERGFELLSRADRALGDKILSWPLRWPRPLRKQTYHGKTYFHYEYIPGQTLTRFASGPSANWPFLREALAKFVVEYPILCQRLNDVIGPIPECDLFETLVAEVKSVNGNEKIVQYAEAGVKHAQDRGWKTCVVHGDIAGNNVVVTPDKRFVAIDWEAIGMGMPQIDLIRLYYDLADGKSTDQQAVDMISWLRNYLRQHFQDQGYTNADIQAFEKLYVVQQSTFLLGRQAQADHLVALFESDELRLSRPE